MQKIIYIPNVILDQGLSLVEVTSQEKRKLFHGIMVTLLHLPFALLLAN